jgi:hypothetical protein
VIARVIIVHVLSALAGDLLPNAMVCDLYSPW